MLFRNPRERRDFAVSPAHKRTLATIAPTVTAPTMIALAITRPR